MAFGPVFFLPLFAFLFLACKPPEHHLKLKSFHCAVKYLAYIVSAAGVASVPGKIIMLNNYHYAQQWK